MFKLLTEKEQIRYIRKKEIKNVELLEILINSKSWKVRNEMVYQKSLTEKQKEKLLNDEHYIVVESAKKEFL